MTDLVLYATVCAGWGAVMCRMFKRLVDRDAGMS